VTAASHDRPTSLATYSGRFQRATGNQDRLVTQMYFEGDPYNASDPFLNSAGRKEVLITRIQEAPPDLEPGSKLVRFDIVLYKG
jgi:protocatechuate 3,4-dioxygenase, beta subunit